MEDARKIPIYTIDAFTKTSFSGNSAAICLVGNKPLSESSMQNMAAEMNISETAFIQLLNVEDNYKTSKKFGLRWFTPTNEVPLCGHATLASAAVVFAKCDNVNEKITFVTLSGELHCSKNEGQIKMDLPLNEPRLVTGEETERYSVEQIMRLTLGKDFKDVVENVVIAERAKKLVIQLKDSCSRNFLESVKPHFKKLQETHDGSFYKGVVMVTVKSQEKNYDFLSRYFAPWNGINEDPVTGSAHTALGPYWNKVLNKNPLKARQCSWRGGNVDVFVRDDDRVDVSGYATVVISGTVQITDGC